MPARNVDSSAPHSSGVPLPDAVTVLRLGVGLALLSAVLPYLVR